MGRLLGSIFGLRRDERRLGALMAAYHFLLLVTLYLLKPVRDSLFLSGRGADELPFVFILTTVAVLPVAALHTRAGRRFRVGPLIDGVSLFLVASLVGLRALLDVSGAWTAYVLYAWVSIYGLLVTSQFWLLANALFTASQSKRVFTLLSAGGILGAIVGGEVTGLLVDTLNVASENLLWGAGGVLLASTGLGRWVRTAYSDTAAASAVEGGADSDDAEDPAQALGAFSTIRDSRHIQLIVGTLTLLVVVTTLVDYQFKTVAARAFASEEGLTTFLGQFYGRVSLVALVVQFVLAPRLMRVVGIGGALSVLPAVLALGSVGMLLVPGLAAGVLLRGGDQSLKHSIDKTARELLFVPVPLEKKKRVKVFIDLFVDQGAKGLGGVLLVGLAYGAGLSVQILSVVTLGLIAVWGVLTYRARQTYVDQFRAKLREREAALDREDADDADEDEADLDELLKSLCSHSEARALQALDELEQGTMPVPVEAVLCLLDHPTPAVRAQALRVLRVREVENVAEEAAEALRDPDLDVQVAAARYLYCQLTDNHHERLRQGLRHDDPQIRAATVGLIAEEGGPAEYELVTEPLLRRLVALEGPQAADTRTHVARILGVLDRPYRNELLRQLLRDDEPQVVRAVIEAAGRTGERTFVYPLLRVLGDETYEAAAREALTSFEAPIHGTLYDLLVDDTEPLALRRQIPPLFAAGPGALGRSLLVRSLEHVPIPVRHAAVRALSKIHAAGDATADADRIDAAIERETRHYAALGQILRLSTRSGADDRPLSPARLRSHRDEALERIFRLLGVRYDQRDFYDAYLGLTSDDPSLKDSAVELVDNLVAYDTRRYLLPLLDDPGGEQALRIGGDAFDLQLRTWDEARRYLRQADDPRLVARLDGATDGRNEEPTPARAEPVPSS